MKAIEAVEGIDDASSVASSDCEERRPRSPAPSQIDEDTQQDQEVPTQIQIGRIKVEIERLNLNMSDCDIFQTTRTGLQSSR